MRNAAVLMLALALGACAGGQQQRGPRPEVIDMALRGAPGEAQPSKIVAAEIAFARSARENGQWTAFREFAGPGAIIHGRNGTILAAPWLAELSDPETPVQWGPKAVVISCDATLAVSQGRFVDPDGIVGNFVTVWQRQDDREYKWIYDVGGPDDPQPAKRAPDEIDGPSIVVTSIDAVQGLIADCPKRGEAVPPAPAIPLLEENMQGGGVSPDGTLRWRWEHRADGTKYVAADYLYQGVWQTAIEEELASPAE